MGLIVLSCNEKKDVVGNMSSGAVKEQEQVKISEVKVRTVGSEFPIATIIPVVFLHDLDEPVSTIVKNGLVGEIAEPPNDARKQVDIDYTIGGDKGKILTLFFDQQCEVISPRLPVELRTTLNLWGKEYLSPFPERK